MNVDLPRVHRTLRKCLAHSPMALRDCYAHAALSRFLLSRLGIEAGVGIGFAAVRVGYGPHDCIAYHPAARDGIDASHPEAVIYHCWTLVADKRDRKSSNKIIWGSDRDSPKLLDNTFYQLPEKIARLSAIDGRHRTVTWQQDFLFIDADQVKTFEQVCNGAPGDVFYSRQLPLEQQCKQDAQEYPASVLEEVWSAYESL